MTEPSSTDTPHESSRPKSQSRQFFLKAILKGASWIYGSYRAMSKAYEFIRSIVTVWKDWQG